LSTNLMSTKSVETPPNPMTIRPRGTGNLGTPDGMRSSAAAASASKVMRKAKTASVWSQPLPADAEAPGTLHLYHCTLIPMIMSTNPPATTHAPTVTRLMSIVPPRGFSSLVPPSWHVTRSFSMPARPKRRRPADSLEAAGRLTQ